MRRLVLSVAAVASLIASSGVHAHHSPARYDLQRTITLDGQVERYEWTNPHVYIHVEVVSTDGTAQTWLIEGGSPSMMERSGWFASSLERGDQVEIQANPARDAAHRIALALTMRKGDAEPLVVRGTPSTPAALPRPESAEGLAGNWLPTRPEQLRFVGAATAPGQPPADADWNLTAAGQAALATGDFIRAETVDAVERHVRLTATSHADAEFSNQGHSIGRWDEGALTVDTDHFAKHSSGDRTGLPSSLRKHVSERLTYTPYRCDRENAERFRAE
jgi:Family of unknown function (DUF6152)